MLFVVLGIAFYHVLYWFGSVSHFPHQNASLLSAKKCQIHPNFILTQLSFSGVMVYVQQLALQKEAQLAVFANFCGINTLDHGDDQTINMTSTDSQNSWKFKMLSCEAIQASFSTPLNACTKRMVWKNKHLNKQMRKLMTHIRDSLSVGREP